MDVHDELSLERWLVYQTSIRIYRLNRKYRLLSQRNFKRRQKPNLMHACLGNWGIEFEGWGKTQSVQLRNDSIPKYAGQSG